MTGRSWAFIAVAVAAASLFAAWHYIAAPPAHAAGPQPQPEVPVGVAKAEKQDIPVYFDGLGTVQAFNVVEIKAQVTGILIALPAQEGQEVHKGDVVAEIDPRPYQATLDQAMAQRAEDAATLQSAELDLKRYQSLAKSQFAPVQQVDDQQSLVSKTAASIAADEAAVETARINLGYCVIRAPFDGRVSLYEVDIGNLIQVGGATGIVSITQDKPIAIVFTLPESELPRVQDARARGDVAVIAQDGSTNANLATGVLLTPNNTIDATTGTISLRAKFSNADDHLWPGQFVNARVQVDQLKGAVTIPTGAIEHGPTGLFVYVVQPDQTVQQVTIQGGYEDNGRTVITKGLAGTEAVVESGQSRLAPGTKVKVAGPGDVPA